MGGTGNQGVGKVVKSSIASWRADAKAMGGGLAGNLRVAGDTTRMIGREALSQSPEGIGAGTVGATLPSTRSDVGDLFTNGFSLHPVNAPVQFIGGWLGSAFK
jgi:hypothetical protein